MGAAMSLTLAALVGATATGGSESNSTGECCVISTKFDAIQGVDDEEHCISGSDPSAGPGSRTEWKQSTCEEAKKLFDAKYLSEAGATMTGGSESNSTGGETGECCVISTKFEALSGIDSDNCKAENFPFAGSESRMEWEPIPCAEAKKRFDANNLPEAGEPNGRI